MANVAGKENRDPALSGSCSCGQIFYTSSVLPRSISHCHCITCQKLSGVAFGTWASFKNWDLTWSSSQGSLDSHIKLLESSIAIRGFCNNCSSPLFFKYHCEPEYTDTSMGSVDRYTGELVEPPSHIFLSQRPKWSEYPVDKLKKYDQFSPAFENMLRKWEEEGMKKRTDGLNE